MDLETAIANFERSGYRLEMIMPADSPRTAVVTNGKELLRLTATAAGVRTEPFDGFGDLVIPNEPQDFVFTRANNAAWVTGRAGMQYRDLIPGRLGGRFIASHIRIVDGGPVPDYVHHHRIRFQMIFVHKGWVRVVYQDQGKPFVMNEGDCVLQPPGIRHRVLESSAGLEVVEIGCPAEHETFRDHALDLPTPRIDRDRTFGDQRFAYHSAASAPWQQDKGFTFQDTEISAATDGLASVRILRLKDRMAHGHDGEFLFLMALKGTVRMAISPLLRYTLGPGDACVVPPGLPLGLKAQTTCEILEVALPAIRSN